VDDPFDLSRWPPVPPKLPPTREPLFDFRKDHHAWECELRYSEYGVEAVFFEDGWLFYSHRFPTKAEAVFWAEQQRRGIETGRADV